MNKCKECKECAKRDKKFDKLLKKYEAMHKDLDKYEYTYLNANAAYSKIGRIEFGRKK